MKLVDSALIEMPEDFTTVYLMDWLAAKNIKFSAQKLNSILDRLKCCKKLDRLPPKKGPVNYHYRKVKASSHRN